MGTVTFYSLALGIIAITTTYVKSQTCDVADPNLTADLSVQTFTSVGYDDNTGSYIKDMSCSWLIYSGSENLTILMIYTYNTSCSADRINIHDGIDAAATPFLDVSGDCGLKNGKDVTNQEYAFVTMVTDDVGEMSGFSMDYIAGRDFSSGGCVPGSVAVTKFIDVISTDFQYLSTPDFPGEYPRSYMCRWLLTNTAGRVDIETLFVDTEENTLTGCRYDHLGVYDGEVICENNIVSKLCSSHPLNTNFNYTSSGIHLLVTFVSDGSTVGNGFLLRYRANNEPYSTAPPSNCNCQNVQQVTNNQYEMRSDALLPIILILLIIIIVLTVMYIYSKIKSKSPKGVNPVKEVLPASPVIKPNALRARKTLNYMRSIDLTKI